MFEYLVAKCVDYILPRFLKKHGFPYKKRLVEHADCKICNSHADNKLHVYSVRFQIVGDLTDEKRQDYIENNVEEYKCHRADKLTHFGF